MRNSEPKNCGGLAFELCLKQNVRISITCNVSIPDGICNNVQGVVKEFTRSTSGQIQIIWIKPDSPEVGSRYKTDYAHFYKNYNISTDLVPIFACKIQFNTGGWSKQTDKRNIQQKKYFRVKKSFLINMIFLTE